MPDSESFPSDLQLLERCRSGDDRAFRQIVERYYERLLATAVGMLGPGADADAVAQDAFLLFYKSLDRFEGRSSLGTYLTRIAMNQSLKTLRRRQSWLRRFVSRDDPDQASREPILDEPLNRKLEGQERAERIREAVQSLKPEFRSVVVLRFLDERSTAECAKILQIPEGTVMSRLSRALDKLAPLLKTLEPSPSQK